MLLDFPPMERSSRAHIPKSVLWLVLLSFALQVASIGVFRQYRTRTPDDHFGFGWEMGRIARSIAQGHGYGSPYGVSTGLTAWDPSMYPTSMIEVFMVFVG